MIRDHRCVICKFVSLFLLSLCEIFFNKHLYYPKKTKTKQKFKRKQTVIILIVVTDTDLYYHYSSDLKHRLSTEALIKRNTSISTSNSIEVMDYNSGAT